MRHAQPVRPVPVAFNASADEQEPGDAMGQPDAFYCQDDGRFPNSRLPALVYRHVLPPDHRAMTEAFAANGWSNAWLDGIFTYHHFHSTAHEVLGIASGAVRVRLGGPGGRTVAMGAGDVVVIPAGVAHRNVGQSDGLEVVGAYPGGADTDTRRGDAAEYQAAKRAAAAVSPRVSDPVTGGEGALGSLWVGEASRR